LSMRFTWILREIKPRTVDKFTIKLLNWRCGWNYFSRGHFPNANTPGGSFPIPTWWSKFLRLRRSLLIQSWRGAGLWAAAFRLFLSQQLQKHLPLGIIFGFSESPFEDDQVFAVYEFFHSVLLSMGRSFNLVTSSHGQQATARAVAMLLHRNVLIRWSNRRRPP